MPTWTSHAFAGYVAASVLAEAVAGGETVVAGLVDVGQGGPAVPAAHFGTGGGEAGALAEGLEQAVFVQGCVGGVVGAELVEERAFEEFDVAVVELGEGLRSGFGEEGAGAGEGGSSEGGGGFHEGTARGVHADSSGSEGGTLHSNTWTRVQASGIRGEGQGTECCIRLGEQRAIRIIASTELEALDACV